MRSSNYNRKDSRRGSNKSSPKKKERALRTKALGPSSSARSTEQAPVFSENELSKTVRENMALSRPKLRKSLTVQKPSLKVQQLMRSLVAGGHMGEMGQRSLMRPFAIVRHIRVNGWLTSQASVFNSAAYELQLDQLPGFADFTALFDQYTFKRVHWKLVPRSNVMTLAIAAVAATTVLGQLVVASDPDDSTAPAAETELYEYEKAQFFAGYQVAKGSYKPRAAIAAYGGAFTQFADFDGWVDCASDDTAWYALKATCTSAGAAQTTFQVWDLWLSVEAEFRFIH